MGYAIFCDMTSPVGATAPGSGHATPVSPPKRCLGLAAAWGLLGAATCTCEFVISTIPIGPDGRTVPGRLLLLCWLLEAYMMPFCAVAPFLLLRAGYTYLRRSAGAGMLWTLAWGAVASASLAVEALFLIRIVHWLRTPYGPNLGYMAWHAVPGRGRPGDAGLEGRGRGPVQARPGSDRRAGGGAGCGHWGLRV